MVDIGDGFESQKAHGLVEIVLVQVARYPENLSQSFSLLEHLCFFGFEFSINICSKALYQQQSTT